MYCKSRFNPEGVAQQEIVEPLQGSGLYCLNPRVARYARELWATLFNVFDVKKKSRAKAPSPGGAEMSVFDLNFDLKNKAGRTPRWKQEERF